jgi:neutral ceramidase
VVVSGLVNEFVLYFTTPEEYRRQHYEGGNTHFGTYSSVLVQEELAKLANALVNGEPAQAPVPFDPTNGVTPNGPAYGSGARSGAVAGQPAGSYPRLGHAAFAWRGGAQGLDRPVDRAFVVVQRRAGGRWVRFDSDLGLAMLWQVDDEGNHQAMWEIPLSAPAGRYRFVIQAKRYRLESSSFRVVPSTELIAREVPSGAADRVTVVLEYPGAVRDVDLTTRPEHASGGVVMFRVGDELVRVARRSGTEFSVRAPAGTPVSVEAGRARDRFGNANGDAVVLR